MVAAPAQRAYHVLSVVPAPASLSLRPRPSSFQQLQDNQDDYDDDQDMDQVARAGDAGDEPRAKEAEEP